MLVTLSQLGKFRLEDRTLQSDYQSCPLKLEVPARDSILSSAVEESAVLSFQYCWKLNPGLLSIVSTQVQ
jgi:hypothetical protein